uniref:Sn1-specific diacylglycerol lipase alpha-like n=1 Tax=Saccoglossus kowalevskii TaxID=10224 RepID=A0ABM0MAW8_SACKO|nr:PREDICTED: sn1-specific diacylglycerol lipase alpha-like [Saccoglossus kowalevskii]
MGLENPVNIGDDSGMDTAYLVNMGDCSGVDTGYLVNMGDGSGMDTGYLVNMGDGSGMDTGYLVNMGDGSGMDTGYLVNMGDGSGMDTGYLVNMGDCSGVDTGYLVNMGDGSGMDTGYLVNMGDVSGMDTGYLVNMGDGSGMDTGYLVNMGDVSGMDTGYLVNMGDGSGMETGLIVLSVVLGVVEFDMSVSCIRNLHDHVLGYIVILCVCITLEALISWLSLRGTIMYTRPRDKIAYILYVRLAVLVVELVWLIFGLVWVADHYNVCPAGMAKRTVLGIVVCNWVVMFTLFWILWCTFDRAGRSWVKLKRDKKQEAIKRSMSRVERRMSRAKNIMLLANTSPLNVALSLANAFGDVARLFSEFFHELDVVPSDIIAGLLLLREEQKRRRRVIVESQSNNVFQFLSGVPIAPSTNFLNLQDPMVGARLSRNSRDLAVERKITYSRIS